MSFPSQAAAILSDSKLSMHPSRAAMPVSKLELCPLSRTAYNGCMDLSSCQCFTFIEARSPIKLECG